MRTILFESRLIEKIEKIIFIFCIIFSFNLLNETCYILKSLHHLSFDKCKFLELSYQGVRTVRNPDETPSQVLIELLDDSDPLVAVMAAGILSKHKINTIGAFDVLTKDYVEEYKQDNPELIIDMAKEFLDLGMDYKAANLLDKLISSTQNKNIIHKVKDLQHKQARKQRKKQEIERLVKEAFYASTTEERKKAIGKLIWKKSFTPEELKVVVSVLDILSKNDNWGVRSELASSLSENSLVYPKLVKNLVELVDDDVGRVWLYALKSIGAWGEDYFKHGSKYLKQYLDYIKEDVSPGLLGEFNFRDIIVEQLLYKLDRVVDSDDFTLKKILKALTYWGINSSKVRGKLFNELQILRRYKGLNPNKINLFSKALSDIEINTEDVRERIWSIKEDIEKFRFYQVDLYEIGVYWLVYEFEAAGKVLKTITESDNFDTDMRKLCIDLLSLKRDVLSKTSLSGLLVDKSGSFIREASIRALLKPWWLEDEDIVIKLSTALELERPELVIPIAESFINWAEDGYRDNAKNALIKIAKNKNLDTQLRLQAIKLLGKLLR